MSDYRTRRSGVRLWDFEPGVSHIVPSFSLSLFVGRVQASIGYYFPVYFIRVPCPSLFF
jgi:hypothetical protein